MIALADVILAAEVLDLHADDSLLEYLHHQVVVFFEEGAAQGGDDTGIHRGDRIVTSIPLDDWSLGTDDLHIFLILLRRLCILDSLLEHLCETGFVVLLSIFIGRLDK